MGPGSDLQRLAKPQDERLSAAEQHLGPADKHEPAGRNEQLPHNVQTCYSQYGGPLGRFWAVFPPFFRQKWAVLLSVLLSCSFEAKERAMLGQLRAPQTRQ